MGNRSIGMIRSGIRDALRSVTYHVTVILCAKVV